MRYLACSQLAHVPDAFRTDWARAQSEVFAILLDGFALWRASGDRSALDRGLKWHLALSAILLRGRRRAGRRGDVTVAQRFGHWRAGRRDLLVRLWLDDRGRSAEYRRLRAESSTPDPAATIERVLEHIDDGELSRALRLLHSAGIAEVDEGVLAQLRAKHPERGEPVPAAIEGDFTRHRFDLTEHFRRLRRSAGAGPDGCRNEYRTALTAQFDDPEAAQVMRRFDQFATLLANVDLPRWFYVAWSVSRICPLRKTASDRVDDAAYAVPVVEPTIQPVGGLDVEASPVPDEQGGMEAPPAVAGSCSLGRGAGAISIDRRSPLGNPFTIPATLVRRRIPRETRRLRERLRTAYALLFGPGGIDAARAYAEEHDLEISEPRLEPEAITRRDTELRRIAALVAAGAHVQLACTQACRDACHGAVICQQVILRARAVSPEEAAAAAEAMAAAPAGEQPEGVQAPPAPPRASPDVRPVNIGNVDRRAILGYLVRGMERAAELHLAPRQVSVGVSSGISILYHGLRLLLEVHPDFLVVRIDLRNAYNESRRAQVLQRMAAVPGVASLVPLMHAMYGPAGIIVLPDGSRLFAGSDRGDFEEGLPQGSPESSLAFCVLIQEAVQELHEALAGGGGGATFIMDDGYCYGRPEEVLPAIRRFADRLTDLGLHLQFRKCSYYSPRTLQGAVLRDLDALGISRGGVMRTPEGAEATQREICIIQPFLPGITVGGVPLGHEAFIRQYMSTLTAGFVSYIRSTIHQLQPASSFAMWSCLYSAIQTRLDFWLQHLTPEETEATCHTVDAELRDAVEALTYHGATASEEVRLRVRLPIWRRGCGIRSRLSLAPAAFCSSFRTACERLLDTRMADGVTRPGFFPQLAHRLGARSFDFDTPDLRMSTLLASDSDLGHAFSDAWALLREEVDGVVDVTQSPGLLSHPAETVPAQLCGHRARQPLPRTPHERKMPCTQAAPHG